MPRFTDHLDRANNYHEAGDLRAAYRELLRARRQTSDHNELVLLAKWMGKIAEQLRSEEDDQ